MKLPYRAFDFTGEHITYNVPATLAACGHTWRMMSVHMSSRESEPVYPPNCKPARRCYGLGNFYSLNGHLTHYHNCSTVSAWFRGIRSGF